MCMHAPLLHILITPLPLAVSLPLAPYVSVSLPLSSVISIWCILAAVVGSLFSMWAGLISVLWWQKQWQSDLFSWNNESPKEPNTPRFVSAAHAITNNFVLMFMFSYHRITHMVQIVPDTWLRPSHLIFRTSARAQPTYELLFEWWGGHLIHVWVATCVVRLISPSPASGLLKGSVFGCLLHLSHIIPQICLLTLEGTDA